MKILSSTLLISFMTVFAASANAGAHDSENVVQQTKARLVNCSDCLDAGYRRGYADATAAALENTPAGSSSVTTPLSYRKPAYMHQSYVPQARHRAHHAGHGHHTQAQILDCERTDALNRAAKPITTVISTQQAHHHNAPIHRPHAPIKKPIHTYIKHGNHSHHTAAEKADCALTDALNRASKTISTVISSTSHKTSPIKQYMKQTYSHGNHSHHSEVEKADCTLTDALNRDSVTRVIRKY